MKSSKVFTDNNAVTQTGSPTISAQDMMDIPDHTGEENTTLCVADIRDMLVRTQKGTVVQSASNCSIVLREDPILKGHIRLNEMTDRICIEGAVPWKRNGDPGFTDTDFNNIVVRLEKFYELTNDKKISRAIDIVANENRYHPVREYLETLEWDGIPRVDKALHHFLGAEENEYTAGVLRYFMLGAVERLCHPGCKFDCMLCLVGGQGAGKSTFFRFLALSDDWFTDDMKRLNEDKSYSFMQGHWIIELPELSALKNTNTNEAVKAFLSRQKDTYRTPYDRYSRDRKRQCVFGGTTNEKQFLPLDRTGNRRFLPVEIHAENAEVHILADEAASREYFRQMWAEIMVIWKEGDICLKLPDEIEAMADILREEFSQEDTDAGEIYDFLDTCRYPRVCSKMLYREALGKTFEDPKLYELRSITEIVNIGIASGRIIGWKAFTGSQRFQTYGTQRGWERIGDPPVSLQNRSAGLDGFVPVPKQEELPFK